jgi:hypothetical protein
MQRLSAKLRDWYEGEWVQPGASDAVLMLNHYRRHWTSRLAHRIVNFYMAEWRWLLPFLVACIGAAVAVWKLP